MQTGPPNKRKSRLICVCYEPTSKPVPLCTRQVAHRTSFLSRQRDIIASFSFGACIVYTEFFIRIVFWKYIISDFSIYFESYMNFTLGVHRTFSSQDFIVIRSLCLLRARNMEAVDTSWPVSTAIVSAHVAEKR